VGESFEELQVNSESLEEVRLQIVGKRFADLRVVRDVRHYRGARHRVIVKCDCGKVIRVEARRLTSGGTLSCGHRRRINLAGRLGCMNLRHGHAKNHSATPEYGAYRNAKRRCTVPSDPWFVSYGGRSIKFLFTTFEEFLNALKTRTNPSGLRPSSKHSLDRKDNDGPYGIVNGVSNIRWALPVEQRLNQRPRKRK
jgi:hypothetical protein